MPRKRKTVDVPGPKLEASQVFEMVRPHDETGVSGTGVVADGIVFPSGACVVEWRGPTPCVQIWHSFAAFKSVHIDPHPDNKTDVVWRT